MPYPYSKIQALKFITMGFKTRAFLLVKMCGRFVFPFRHRTLKRETCLKPAQIHLLKSPFQPLLNWTGSDFSTPERLESIMCKWTRPFWGTDCRRSPKSLSSAQAASLCSAGIERARECLQGYHFEMLSQYPQSAFYGVLRGSRVGSAAVCDPNPPRPFARSRWKNGMFLANNLATKIGRKGFGQKDKRKNIKPLKHFPCLSTSCEECPKAISNLR